MNNIELANAIRTELETIEPADETLGPRSNRGKITAADRQTWEDLIEALEGPQPETVTLPYGYIERNCLGHLWNTPIYAKDFLSHYERNA